MEPKLKCILSSVADRSKVFDLDIPRLVTPAMARDISNLYNIPCSSGRVLLGIASMHALILEADTHPDTIHHLMERFGYRIGTVWLNDLEGQPYYKVISTFERAEQAVEEMTGTTFRVHVIAYDGEDGGMIEFPRMYCLFPPEKRFEGMEEDKL